MSISKSQAEALADGFLDQLGTTQDELRPRETISEILLIAAELVEAAQENLNSSNSNASGKLSESIEAEEPVINGNSMTIDVTMLFYGQFINKGVKGRKGGSGVYSFKHDMPSKDFVKAIKTYIRTASRKITNTSSASISKNEIKNRSVAEASSAFAMARSIIQHGIKATGFMDKAIVSVSDIANDRLGQALRVDIINSLPDKI